MVKTSDSSQPAFGSPNCTRIWFILSLAIALLYRLPALYAAFWTPYTVQDDARQHIFWMQRFADPDLFPNDLFADYFQSVAPWGYTHLYQAAVALGIEVWTANKILPVVLGLIVGAYTFGTVLQLIPVPIAGFIAVLFLSQTFTERDDLVSATPVAFFYPLFLAFLYYLLKGKVIPCTIAIVLMGLFYPQGVLVMSIMLFLRLLRWSKGRLHLSRSRLDYWLWGAGWLAAFGVLLPYALHDSPYGPVVTAEQGQQMFALSFDGWSRFFGEDPFDFWVFGRRSGFLPEEWDEWDFKTFPQVWLTLAIPFLIAFPGRSRLAKTDAPRMAILLQIVIASTLCFAAAHLLLFELHLPNRYTEHSFRILVAIGTGIALALWGDRLRLDQSPRLQRRLLLLLFAGAIAPFFFYGLTPDGSKIFGQYVYGYHPRLYAYLQNQPKDIQIASIAKEVNSLPSFAQRSIFVGGEGFALPYHLGYYREVQQRAVDLANAQYSLDASTVRAFLQQYPIDFWLVHDDMFTPEWVKKSEWLEQYSRATNAAKLAMLAEQPTVIETLAATCLVLEEDDLRVLDADCLRQQV